MKRLLRLTRSSLACILSIFTSGPDRKVGGQAVIEGVMMRSPSVWAVVVRDPEGNLQSYKEVLKKTPFLGRLPFFRGTVLLWQSLKLGMKALRFSAEVALPEQQQEGSPLWFGLSAAVAAVLALGIFLLLPLYITRLAGQYWQEVATNTILFNSVDGLLRVLFFLVYVFAIGLWSEMRRIYQYHGAEHKVINAFEDLPDKKSFSLLGLQRDEAPLRTSDEVVTSFDEISRIRQYSRFHPRCGTSFLLVVMIVSILVFSFIPHSWVFYKKFLARVVLIPIVAGISYEFIKVSSKRPFRFFALPGFLLQGLTTREPEDEQIEVALASLKEVL